MDGILSLIEGEDVSKPAALVHIVQAWLTPERPGFSFMGRYVPEQESQEAELDSKLSVAGKRDFEDWLRESTTLVVNTEINVQLGEFTIKKNAVQPLPQYMMRNEDFISVFQRVSTDDIIQCADVKNTTNRKWVRLVGLGYDLQLWASDSRRPTIPLKNSYESCTATWVKDIFDPWRHLVLPDVELYILSESILGQTFLYEQEVITMCGYSDNIPRGNDNDKQSKRDSRTDSNVTVTLKEVVVYRYPRVFHIYNVVEYGRRWYRQLIFSSDPDLSLHEMKLSRQALNSTILECSGDSGVIVEPSNSLVISKDALQEGSGRLTYIPSRLLCGLMPSSLLNQYNFWQNEDDSLTGYMSVLDSNKSITRSILNIQVKKHGKGDDLGFSNSLADAVISRVLVSEGSPTQSDSEKEFNSRPDTSKGKEYLVNLMAVLAQYVKKYNNSGDIVGPVSKIKELVDFDGETGTLHALVRLVLRLDCLANILAWSKSDPSASPNSLISIDTIELPRLRLTFEKKISAITGHVQYVCVEQSGMYLTGYDDSLRFADLLEGLPKAVLLRNADNEYFVLLPAIAKPVLTRALGSGPATYNMVMSMTNKQWLANTGEAAYFTYPIHSSGCFMSSRSIASSLYLLVLRLMSRNYRDAYRLIESCVCDNVLTPQEKQIYDVIGTIKDDFHPDVHACRLKLYFVTYGCSDVMPYQFSVEKELLGYVTKIRLVSSYCKLTPDEEIFLTAHVPMEDMGINLGNRERLIRASFNLSFESDSKKGTNRVFTAEYPKPTDTNTDLSYTEPLDLNLLDTERDKTNYLKKLSFGQYSRPESVTGTPAVALLMKYFDNNTKPGFFLLYELFTGALNITILPQDKPRDLGSILMSVLPDDNVSGVQSVILRIMESDNDLATKMPAFEDRRKLKLPKLTGLDIFQAHVKVAAGFVQTSMDDLKLEKLAFKRTKAFRNPDSVQASQTLEGASDYYEGRSWLNPRINDFARPKRQVSSAAVPRGLVQIAAYFTPSEVSFFLGSPLHSIDLRNYVEQKNLAGRGEELVSSESPLRVMLHPSSNSYIARSAVTRLEKDVADFSIDENKGVLPVLKAINTTGGLMEGASLDRALSSITSMITALEKLRERDSVIVKSGVVELLDYCNSSVTATSTDVQAIAHSLRQKAGIEVPMVRKNIIDVSYF